MKQQYIESVIVILAVVASAGLMALVAHLLLEVL